MKSVKLSSALPPDDLGLNGLTTPAVVKQFVSDPRRAVLVVALLTSPETRVNNELAVPESQSVLRVQHIEVVPAGQQGAAAKILADAYEARTGQLTLPIEPGELWRLPDEESAED